MKLPILRIDTTGGSSKVRLLTKSTDDPRRRNRIIKAYGLGSGFETVFGTTGCTISPTCGIGYGTCSSFCICSCGMCLSSHASVAVLLVLRVKEEAAPLTVIQQVERIQ